MVGIVIKQDMNLNPLQGNRISRPNAGSTLERADKNISSSMTHGSANPQQRDAFLLSTTDNTYPLGTYNNRAQITDRELFNSSSNAESTHTLTDSTQRKRVKRNSITSTNTFAQNFDQTTRGKFARLQQEAEQYRRSTDILIKAMKQKGGLMQESKIEGICFNTDRLMKDVAKHYANFSADKTVSEFMHDRLTRESDDIKDFLNNKNLINRWISARPNATDSDLLDYAKSLLSETARNEILPINVSEPFSQYLDTLLYELDWVDWGKANKNINSPLQAIHALYVYGNHKNRPEYFSDMPKLDGLALGERIAKGSPIINIAVGLNDYEKIQLDKAALLFCLAVEPNLQIQEAPRDAMTLGTQLTLLRESFLLKLRDEWWMSQMFMPNNTRSNIYFDQNALVHAQGKTITDLANDTTITSIPGINTRHPQAIERLVRQKLGRLGESTEYKFGTLQHGMATILKRSLLLQGNATPDSFGTEVEMVGQFITLCRTWETKQSIMLNPKLMLAQYLAHASGENVLVGATSTQQKITALQTYLAERWLANYGEPPQRFDRRAAALNILKTTVGPSTTEYDLTIVPQEYTRVVTNSVIEQKSQTPLDRFLYVADYPVLIDNSMAIEDHRLLPRALLQAAEEEYNRGLLINPWIQARAKENIRITGGELNTETLKTAQEALISEFHAETESERDWHAILRFIKGQPIIGSIWQFVEGLYNGNAEEMIGAIPVVGNIYEFEEGIRHGDVSRAISAIPVLGSGYQLEEALRKGDGLQVVLSAEAFIFDLATLKGAAKSAASKLGITEHTLLKETELPAAHAIGLRSYLTLSKTLDIPLKGPEHIDTMVENFKQSRPGLSAIDPYGIESLINHGELSLDITEEPISPFNAFGEEMDKYRSPGPRDGILPNEEGIYIDENLKYLKSGEHYYPVRYDIDNATWRVYFPDNPVKPAVPVRYVNGKWEIHSDVGLRGGGPYKIPKSTNDETSHSNAGNNDNTPLELRDPPPPEMRTLYNEEMSASDNYYNRRQQSMGEYYGPLKYGAQFGKKAYEGSFDVEGSITGHQMAPELYVERDKKSIRYFDIVTHGSPKKVLSITGEPVGPIEFATEFKRYVKYYPPGTPIRLFACETAKGGSRSFAQRFANAMNVPVKAYMADVANIDNKLAREKFAKIFLPET
ncbi:hypothetical protein ACUHMQ_02345 [Chitinimonas sp. PSY-7]